MSRLQVKVISCFALQAMEGLTRLKVSSEQDGQANQNVSKGFLSLLISYQIALPAHWGEASMTSRVSGHCENFPP